MHLNAKDTKAVVFKDYVYRISIWNVVLATDRLSFQNCCASQILNGGG
jgi:hypothetical protein